MRNLTGFTRETGVMKITYCFVMVFLPTFFFFFFTQIRDYKGQIIFCDERAQSVFKSDLQSDFKAATLLWMLVLHKPLAHYRARTAATCQRSLSWRCGTFSLNELQTPACSSAAHRNMHLVCNVLVNQWTWSLVFWSHSVKTPPRLLGENVQATGWLGGKNN